ncbi:MAG: ferredoxin [Amycolatopsis sp.]|jgi:ferredoxin|nr:ferredoxin [Amycolatopsis sp.]
MEHAEVNQLVVDRNRCEGYGMCQQAAPQLLHLNDDDEPIIDVAAISAAQKPLAGAAVGACPVAALSLSTTTVHR